MPTPDRSHALDHVVVVMFENRSFDNLLGRLYEPGEVESFEGVIGKDLSNPIPAWAEHGADRKVVPYTVATNMDTPNPDPGEEYQHVNTQLFGIIDPPTNRGADVRADAGAVQRAGAGPAADDGRFRRRLHQRVHRRDGPPADLRRVRADHGRLHARADAGAVDARQGLRHVRPLVLRGAVPDVHQPLVLPRRVGVGLRHQHDPDRCLPGAQHRRDDLRAARGQGPDVAGLLRPRRHRVVHRPHPRLAAAGPLRHPLHRAPTSSSRTRPTAKLPTYAFIEPNMLHGHNDMHPPVNALFTGMPADSPSSLLGGEELLATVYDAIRSSSSESGSNAYNTMLLVTFDEHGGCYDHVPPPPAPPPDPSGPAGQMGFTFDRSGVRIPTIAISPWIPERTVVNDEYRDTSLIRTLRERWDLGPPLTGRDAIAPDIAPVLSLAEPRPPETWPDVTAAARARLRRGGRAARPAAGSAAQGPVLRVAGPRQGTRTGRPRHRAHRRHHGWPGGQDHHGAVRPHVPAAAEDLTPAA